MHPNIRLFYYYNFLTDFQFYFPVAILYFSQITGSYALAMSIFSLVMLSSAIFEIPTGIYSDLIGRRKTTILSAFFGLLAVISYALAPSFLLLALGAILEGIGRAFGSGNDDALLYDSLQENGQKEKYPEILGKISSMFQIAASIAAILGSIIASWSFRWVVSLSILPLLLRFIISFKFKEVKNYQKINTNIYAHTKKAIQLFLHNPKLRHISIASSIVHAAGESSYHFESTFISMVWPIWAIGLSRALSGAGAALSFYLSGKIIRKFKEFKILIFDNIYSTIVGMIALIFPTIFSPILLSSGSLLYGISMISQNNLMQQEFSETQRATMSSLNSLFATLSYAIFSPILGYLADIYNPITALLIASIIAFSSTYFYYQAFKKEKAINH